MKIYFVIISLSFGVMLSLSSFNVSRIYAQTPKVDEQILHNLQQGTLPEDIISTTETRGVHLDESLFIKIKSFLESKMKGILGFAPSKIGTFTTKSDAQDSSLVPFEVRPTQQPANINILEIVTNPLQGIGESAIKKTSHDLGQDAGVYSTDCPEDIKNQSKDTRDFQYNCYGKSWFPEEHNPFPSQKEL